MPSKPPFTSAHWQKARMVILYGPDLYRRTEYTRKLRAALREAHGEIGEFAFDGATAQPAEVLDECRSFGLMASHKLVIVDNAEMLVKEDRRPLFERYASEGGSEGATLVLRAGGKWSTGTKLDKAVEASGGLVIACEEATPEQAGRWAQERVHARYGAVLAPDAAAMLVNRVGADLLRLDAELGKLSVAAVGAESKDASGKPLITGALVEEFTGLTREDAAWDIQRTLLLGDAESALAHLRHLIEVNRHSTVPLMYAMLDLARKQHALASAGAQGRDPAQAARALKLWGDSVQAFVQASRGVSPARTLRFLQNAVGQDARNKRGLGDAQRSLEVLIVQLHLLRRAPARGGMGAGGGSRTPAGARA